MPCTTLQSLSKASCEPNNIGGITALYIMDQENIAATGLTITLSSNTITAIVPNPGNTKFATVDFKRNVGNFTVEHVEDLVTGNGNYKATINITLNRREGVKSRSLQILGEGQRFLTIIALGADGTYTHFDFAQLASGSENSGTARADGTNYTLVFTAELNQRPYFVAPGIMPALIA
jgi:hypothetical protein